MIERHKDKGTDLRDIGNKRHSDIKRYVYRHRNLRTQGYRDKVTK